MATSKQHGTKKRNARRSFTDEYKAGAVRLVLDEGKTIAQVARDLSRGLLREGERVRFAFIAAEKAEMEPAARWWRALGVSRRGPATTPAGNAERNALRAEE